MKYEHHALKPINIEKYEPSKIVSNNKLQIVSEILKNKKTAFRVIYNNKS